MKSLKPLHVKVMFSVIATASSCILANIIASLKLCREYRIQPFYSNYIKTLITALLLLVILKPLSTLASRIWSMAFCLLIYLVIFLSLIVLSGSIDREGKALLKALGKKLGINLRNNIKEMMHPDEGVRAFD